MDIGDFNFKTDFDKQCGEIFLTIKGKMMFHCTLCEGIYKDFERYSDHITQEHLQQNADEFAFGFEPCSMENVNYTDLNNLEVNQSLDEGNESTLLQHDDSGTVTVTESNLTSLSSMVFVDVKTEVDDKKNLKSEIRSEPILCQQKNIEINMKPTKKIKRKQKQNRKPYKKPNPKPNQKQNKKRDQKQIQKIQSNKVKEHEKKPIQTSTNERIHKCSICEFACTDKSNLVSHIRRHSSERPHQCPECPKCFYTRTELKTHRRIHTGERPFLCTTCGRSFKTSGLLTGHTKRHENIRDKECDICGRRFYNTNMLRKHLATHSDQRPFKCATCDASFKQVNALRNHTKIHENKLEYECTICFARFNQKPGLHSHMKSRHTSKPPSNILLSSGTLNKGSSNLELKMDPNS